MTQYGHIAILKISLIFQLIYKLTLFAMAQINTEEVQNKLDNFVRGFKWHVVKKRILYVSYKVPGLYMVNLDFFNS